MPALSRAACHSYYRLSVGGAEVPRAGPVLLVANHTNSLMDPALVTVASRRQVRFMAKAPLFVHPGIGWLIRAVGSVPVYRQQDDPRLVAQNFDSFRDVHAALADGFAVGIFPEGISHSAPRLQPLKTGAARIALGAAQPLGHAFPIVPLGLVFRDRRTFRSEARVIVGVSCAWNDLAARGPTDKEAVRELTRRIDASMRAVTLNLHDWRDEQLVRCAERVWRAEFGASSDARGEMERLRLATEALARLRLDEDSEWRQVVRELRLHDRLLTRLGLTPLTLTAPVSSEAAAMWALKRLPLVVALPLAGLGLLLFWLPRELTGTIATKMARREGEDAVPTFRVLYGGAIFLGWFVLLALASSLVLGALGGALVFFVLPVVAFGGLIVAESRRLSWAAIRRFFTLHLQRERVAALRARQRALAARLRDLFERAAA
ncbi:MAG TPA: 1-acyl-sn-glycerol-3-phosphate acyltransferase [Gemmatimonadaceae bacterium]|nr:1-acyl-sn-glycerol-3-phosphate acyltransferase [Gemmatimonadaceae bacterium]